MDVGITNYADDTAEQLIIAWQGIPKDVKTTMQDKWANNDVEDISKEKKKSMLARVKVAQDMIGAEQDPQQMHKNTLKTIANNTQGLLAKHFAPHEIVLNKTKLETIPTLNCKHSRQATRELYENMIKNK